MIDIQPILSISIYYTIDGTSSFPITWYFHAPNIHKFPLFFLVNTKLQSTNEKPCTYWQRSVYRKYSSTLKVGYHIYTQRELKLKAVLKVELVVAPLVSRAVRWIKTFKKATLRKISTAWPALVSFWQTNESSILVDWILFDLIKVICVRETQSVDNETWK